MAEPSLYPSLHRTLRTRLCQLVDIEVPIVQTGMGWVAGPRLVAATSNGGALGILAAATMDLAEMERAIAEVKARTSRSFGVNIRADAPDISGGGPGRDAPDHRTLTWRKCCVAACSRMRHPRQEVS